MPYPNNTGWAPAKERMRIGGYRPDLAQNVEPGQKIANHLQQQGIGYAQARNATSLGKRTHMQNAGIGLQDVNASGEDYWAHALDILSRG